MTAPLNSNPNQPANFEVPKQSSDGVRRSETNKAEDLTPDYQVHNPNLHKTHASASDQEILAGELASRIYKEGVVVAANYTRVQTLEEQFKIWVNAIDWDKVPVRADQSNRGFKGFVELTSEARSNITTQLIALPRNASDTLPRVTTLKSSKDVRKEKLIDPQTGKIRTTPSAEIYSAVGHTHVADTAHKLAILIKRLQERKDGALNLGDMTIADDHAATPVQTIASVTTKATKVDRFPADASYIARTKEYFRYAPNRAGWILLDLDMDKAPQGIQGRINAMGGPYEAIRSIMPELNEVTFVALGSSSSGVYKIGEKPPERDAVSSAHIYILTEDAAKTRLFLEYLAARCWAAGLGWFAISKSGALLRRCLVDTAVGSPERLIFEAPPKLGAGLARVTPTIFEQEGRMLCLHEVEISDEALNEIEKLAIKARDEALPEAERIREASISAASSSIQERFTYFKTKMAKSVAADALDYNILHDEFPLEMADGSTVFVGDLLDKAEQARAVGETISWTIPDPIEGREYGAGSSARVVWSRAFATPTIQSFAHGIEATFQFKRHMGARPDGGGDATRESNMKGQGNVSQTDLSNNLLPKSPASTLSHADAVDLEFEQLAVVQPAPEVPVGPVKRERIKTLHGTTALDQIDFDAIRKPQLKMQHDTMIAWAESVAEYAKIQAAFRRINKAEILNELLQAKLTELQEFENDRDHESDPRFERGVFREGKIRLTKKSGKGLKKNRSNGITTTHVQIKEYNESISKLKMERNADLDHVIDRFIRQLGDMGVTAERLGDLLIHMPPAIRELNEGLHREAERIVTNRKRQVAKEFGFMSLKLAEERARQDFKPKKVDGLGKVLPSTLIYGVQGSGKSTSMFGSNEVGEGILAKLAGLTILALNITKEKAFESYTDYMAMRKEGQPHAILMLGRNAWVLDDKGEPTDEQFCLASESVRQANRLGVSVRKTVCEICPFKNECQYIAQEEQIRTRSRSEEGVIIFGHQSYLFTGALGNPVIDGVIVDEAISDALSERVTILAENIRSTAPENSGDGIDEKVWAVTLNTLEKLQNAALQAGAAPDPISNSILPALVEYQVTPMVLADAADALKKLKEGDAIKDQLRKLAGDDPSVNELEQAWGDYLKKPVDSDGTPIYIYPARKVAEMLVILAQELQAHIEVGKMQVGPLRDAEIKYAEAQHALSITSASPEKHHKKHKKLQRDADAWKASGSTLVESIDGKVVRKTFIQFQYKKKPRYGCPLLHLDGTAELELAKWTLERDEWTFCKIQIPRMAHTTWIGGRSFSKAALLFSTKRSSAGAKNDSQKLRDKVMSRAESWADALGLTTDELLFGGKDEILNTMKKDGHEIESSQHLGAARGINKFKDKRGVVVVGDYMVPANSVDSMGAAMSVGRAEDYKFYPTSSFNETRQMTVQELAERETLKVISMVETRDSNHPTIDVNVNVHPDPLGDMIYRFMDSNERQQLIDRIRATLNAEMKYILIIATTPPEGVDIDEYQPWDTTSDLKDDLIEGLKQYKILPLSDSALAKYAPQMLEKVNKSKNHTHPYGEHANNVGHPYKIDIYMGGRPYSDFDMNTLQLRAKRRLQSLKKSDVYPSFNRFAGPIQIAGSMTGEKFFVVKVSVPQDSRKGFHVVALGLDEQLAAQNVENYFASILTGTDARLEIKAIYPALTPEFARAFDLPESEAVIADKDDGGFIFLDRALLPERLRASATLNVKTLHESVGSSGIYQLIDKSVSIKIDGFEALVAVLHAQEQKLRLAMATPDLTAEAFMSSRTLNAVVEQLKLDERASLIVPKLKECIQHLKSGNADAAGAILEKLNFEATCKPKHLFSTETAEEASSFISLIADAFDAATGDLEEGFEDTINAIRKETAVKPRNSKYASNPADQFEQSALAIHTEKLNASEDPLPDFEFVPLDAYEKDFGYFADREANTEKFDRSW